MKIPQIRSVFLPAAALALAATCTAPAAWAAGPSVDEHAAADAHGQVELSNISGRIEIVGWDKPEVAASGTLSDGYQRVDISSSGTRTTVRVVHGAPGDKNLGVGFGEGGETNLVVHVPRGSSLAASLISSDITVRDVQGDQELQTVSGNVTTAAAGDVRIHTVSGDIQLTAAPQSKLLELSTVSGNLHVTGGGGDVSVNSVSGDATLALGTVSHAQFKAIHGDTHVSLGLAPDGRLEAESISGDMTIDFAGPLPQADFDLQSVGGDLKTCFGQQGIHERYGPGSRLSFREGSGSARVRVETKSGNVTLCAKH